MTQPVEQPNQLMTVWQALGAAAIDESKQSQASERLGIPIIAHLREFSEQLSQELQRQEISQSNGVESNSSYLRFLTILEHEMSKLHSAAQTVLGWQARSLQRSASVAALSHSDNPDVSPLKKTRSHSRRFSVWQALAAVMSDRTRTRRGSQMASREFVNRLQSLSIGADHKIVRLLGEVAQLQQEILQLGSELNQGFLGDLFRLLAGRGNARLYAKANQHRVAGSVFLPENGSWNERASLIIILGAAGLGAHPDASLTQALSLLKLSPEFRQLRDAIQSLKAAKKQIAVQEDFIANLEKSARELLWHDKEVAQTAAVRAHPAQGGLTHV